METGLKDAASLLPAYWKNGFVASGGVLPVPEQRPGLGGGGESEEAEGDLEHLDGFGIDSRGSAMECLAVASLAVLYISPARPHRRIVLLPSVVVCNANRRWEGGFSLSMWAD